MHRRTFATLAALAFLAFLAGPALAAPPAAAKYLYDGKLKAGEKALADHLGVEPANDQTHFGLGAIRFLRAFEKLGTGLHRHGLRTSSAFPGMPRNLARLIPENPKPEKIDYKKFRAILEDVLASLNEAEATLAKVKGDKVALPLHVGRIKLDLLGNGEPISAVQLFRAVGENDVAGMADKVVIRFDRGDVCWLRGYCHLLAALVEVGLSLDGEELFNATAHRFFTSVESPHKWLDEEDHRLEFGGGFFPPFPVIADAVQFVVHGLNLEVKEPARLKNAHAHLKGMAAMSKEMWKHILAETDDEDEWIPNPKQRSVVVMPLSKEVIDEWLETVSAWEDILDGKKLAPFWRGKPGARGVNVKKVFTDPPKRLEIVRWVQGTAATPYLEKGDFTPLADPARLRRLDRTFGGPLGFLGFATWFN